VFSTFAPRGVNPKDQHLYNPKDGKFQCLKSKEFIPVEELNDDYCDCKDGSDEPGTSACAHLSKVTKIETSVGFWCQNKGYKEQVISPTIVDDGICDCCDGTDEPLGKCKNVCKEVGAVYMEKRKREAEAANAGYKIRKAWSDEARELLLNFEQEVGVLKQELDEIQAKEDGFRVAKEEAEQIWNTEKERCDEEARLKREAEEAALEDARQKSAFSFLDKNNDQKVSIDEMVAFDFVEPEEPEARMEALKLILDGESAGFNEFVEVTWDHISTKFNNEGNHISTEQVKETEKSDEEILPSHRGMKGEPVDDDDDFPQGDDFPEDETKTSTTSDEDWDDDEDWEDDDYDVGDDYEMEKYQEASKSKYEQDTPSNLDETAEKAKLEFEEARKIFQENEKIRREKENDIKQKEEKMQQDFGVDKAFFKLYDQCVDLKTTEYTYQVCFFKKAEQKPLGGGVGTNLGRFSGFGDDYLSQDYTGGTKCWNGPDRSCKVVFSCGTENKLIEASEPNRCEYQFNVETPAVCEEINFVHDEL